MRNNEQRKVVLVEIIDAKTREIREESFDEFRLLIETLGFDIVAETSQVLREVNYSFYIGKGKLEEIRQIVRLLGAEYVFIDSMLTYLQLRNLSKEIGVPCIDRPHLILMIFSMRAKTSEGKLQVELSQLKMRLPEIVHSTVNLDQQTGSEMGLKGPGERKTELKRRYIENRVKVLEERLKEIKMHREERRKKRKKSNIPLVAIVGYTNSGKSTLLNALTGADSYVENMLFATLDTLVRESELKDNFKVLFTDTIGFIRDLPAALIYAFHSTLEEIDDAWLIVHLVDATSYEFRNKIEVVNQTLKELNCDKITRILVFNKIDMLESEKLELLKEMYEDAIFISALKGTGIDELKDRIYEILSKFLVKMKIFVPYDKSYLLNMVYENTKVINKKEQDDGVLFFVEGFVENINKFRDFFA